MSKPVTTGEKFNVAELSILREFWGINNAHVILIAENDRLLTDREHLLDDYGLVGCPFTRSNDLSVRARIDSTRYVRLLWKSNEEDDEDGHAAIFEVKFGTKAEGVTAESRERTAESLFDNLESVA